MLVSVIADREHPFYDPKIIEELERMEAWEQLRDQLEFYTLKKWLTNGERSVIGRLLA